MPVWFWVLIATMLGLVFGSFAGVVVYRLPRIIYGQRNLSLIETRSHCSACDTTLQWKHNIPVISYIILRGKCGFCGTQIGSINLVLELVFALVWGGYVALNGIEPLSHLIWLYFLSVLIILFVLDWQCMLLPDKLTLPLIIVGFASAYNGVIGINAWESLLGAFFGYMLLYLVVIIFERIHRVAAMGRGDFKLMGAIAAWLGVQSVCWIILGASLMHIGMSVLIPRWRMSGGQYSFSIEDDMVPESAVPYGPGLIISAILFFIVNVIWN